MSAGAGHVLLLVQNAPIERDTRVQRLVGVLREHDLGVTVICPRIAGDQLLSYPDVRIVRFRAAPERPGPVGFAVEYAWSLLAMAALVVRTLRRVRVGVVHICNPPDFLFLAALPCRAHGARIVFDQHDPAPEMYEARFGRRGVLHRVLLALERASFRVADHVVATNGSLADLAVQRGGRSPSEVTVVRNAPDLTPDEAEAFEPPRRPTGRRRLVWVGHMGPDDGVELALEALRELRSEEPPVELTLVGDGEARADLQRLAASLGVEHLLRWTGWLTPAEVRAELAGAEVGIVPDPSSPRSELSSMIKLTEYLTFGVPVVAFPLRESRATAGGAALFVDESPRALADGIRRLLHDRDLADQLAAAGRERMRGEIGWQVQASRYADLVRALLGHGPDPSTAGGAQPT